MGQRPSVEGGDSGPSPAPPHEPSVKPAGIPSYASAWSVIVSESLDEWQQGAASYGFADYPYGCSNRDCDRDAVCLKIGKAVLRKNTHMLEITRYNKPVCLISYASEPALRSKLTEGFHLSEMIAGMRDSTAVVIFYRWERLQYEAVFITLDLDRKVIQGHFESPLINMSIMECKISPDKTKILVLFYFRRDTNSPFQYDLYVFCATTSRVLDVIHCNTEVRPYVSFDPRYRSSRVAIVNYRSPDDGKDSLVLYCLDARKIIATSHLKLSIIYCGGYFCANFSKDGHFLILQKISENIHGGHCYADSYIFNTSTLKLLHHYFTNLQRFSTFCDSNYAPRFSVCGSRMCILSEQSDGDPKKLYVSVYQLPRPISLQEQCRIAIVQNVRSPALIADLPLPRRIKQFLQFTPDL